MEMAEKWERCEETLKEREDPTETEGSACACSDSDVIFLQVPFPLRSPQLCPSFLSSPTARHPCLSLFHLFFAPGPQSGVNRLLGLKAEQ